mgnify:CR=1 FL=1
MRTLRDGCVLRIVYDPLPGSSIDAAAKEMHALASDENCKVVSTFNGVYVEALPNSVRTETVYPVLEQYHTAVNSRRSHGDV